VFASSGLICTPCLARLSRSYLCQMAVPRHKILSAFAHGSIRCWVYLQATMNDHLRRLLKLAPVIIGNSSQHVDWSDGLRLLRMQHATQSTLEVGKWVQVRKEIYKGDVGYITTTKSTGFISFLFLAYRNHRLPRNNPPSLVPHPPYSTVRPSSGFTILSLSTSKRISTHFGATGSSMG
jgi:hypothetical protein